MEPFINREFKSLWRVLTFGLAILTLLIPVVTGSSEKYSSIPTAERLIIRYQNGNFEILSRTTLQKVLPGAIIPPDMTGPTSGHWFEIQDARNKTIYCRLMSPPNIRYTEYRDPAQGGRLVRKEAVVSERVFSLLVPAESDAKSLVFFGTLTEAKNRTLPAAEIGRLTLR